MTIEPVDLSPFVRDRDWLSGLEESAFRVFVNALLRSRETLPLQLGNDVNPIHYVAQIYAASVPEVKGRLDRVVADHLDNSSASDPPEYIDNLLSLIGRTAPAFCRRALLHICNIQEFKGSAALHDEDLHNKALRVLAAVSHSEEDLALFVRDLRDPRYAPICYGTLYRHQLQLGMTYCRDIVSAHIRDDSAFSLKFVLREMVETCGVRLLAESLLTIERSMSLEEWLALWTAISRFVSVCAKEDDLYIGVTGDSALYAAFTYDIRNIKHRRLLMKLVVNTTYDDGVTSYA
jgi:hypothetical protein